MENIQALLDQAKKCSAQESIQKYSEAAALISSSFGSDSVLLADVLFLYAKSLFEFAIQSSSPLGNESTLTHPPESTDSTQPITSIQSNDSTQPIISIESDYESESDSDQEPLDPVQEDMEIAWESLETACIIYETKSMPLKQADTLLSLGDISMEQGQWKTAIQDFSHALEIKQKILKPYDRELAEAYYKLSLALEFDSELEKALEASYCVFNILSEKKKVLAEVEDECAGKDDLRVKEILDLDSLLPDVQLKIDDLIGQIEQSKKAANAAEPQGPISKIDESSSTTSRVVNDISGLVKSSRKVVIEKEESKRVFEAAESETKKQRVE